MATTHCTCLISVSTSHPMQMPSVGPAPKAGLDLGRLRLRDDPGSTRAVRPSVLYIRRVQGRRVDELAELIVGNLELVEQALEEGSLVVSVKAMRESAGCRSSDRHFDTSRRALVRPRLSLDIAHRWLYRRHIDQRRFGRRTTGRGQRHGARRPVAGQTLATIPIRTGTPMARKASGH